MTDQTTDLTFKPAARKTRRVPTEFYVYFAIIFLATLPLATFTWMLTAIRSRSLTDKGPVARAWSQARIITPIIFSAR
ncbi:MAG: protein pufQ [Rhodobacteraceae bacterium]|nr:protein pufQ [Paracoccaceae bacterium]